MSAFQRPITPIAFNPESLAAKRLDLAPIDPGWILEGAPVASNKLLERSEDGTSWNMFWECTAGRFNWHYDNDETAFITAGEAFITNGTTEERRIGAGDMIFFPAGSSCTWRIPVHVRKFAVLRHPMPRLVAIAVKAWKKVNRKLIGSRGLCVPVSFTVNFLRLLVVEA